MKPGGQSAYVNTTYYYFYIDDCDQGLCDESYHFECEEETEHTTSGSWIEDVTKCALLGESDKSRGGMYVGEDHAYASDPKSATHYVTLSY